MGLKNGIKIHVHVLERLSNYYFLIISINMCLKISLISSIARLSTYFLPNKQKKGWTCLIRGDLTGSQEPHMTLRKH